MLSEDDKKWLKHSEAWYDKSEAQDPSAYPPENIRKLLIDITKDGGYNRPPVRRPCIQDHLVAMPIHTAATQVDASQADASQVDASQVDASQVDELQIDTQ